MAIQIFHKNEIGKGLDYTDAKVSVKPDNSGNVQFEVTEAGIKGVAPEFDPSSLQAEIEQLAEIDRDLSGKLFQQSREITALEKENAALKARLEAVENREDLHASGLSLDEATNEVVLTVEGGAELRVGLGKFLNIVPTADEIYAEIKQQILDDVKADLKGEEIQDFAGTVKGYLINV